MEQRIIFQNKLAELTALARRQGGMLTREQVEGELAAVLTGQQLELVYQYLEQQKVRIEGWSQDIRQRLSGRRRLNLEEGQTETDGGDETADGEEGMTLTALEQYLAELEDLAPSSREQKWAMLRRLYQGDRQVLHQLVQAYLPMVCDMAGEYEKDAAMHVEDLVQEGNMALWIALERLEETDSLAAAEAILMNAVSTGMEEAMRERLDEQDADEAMARQVNRLSDAVRTLEGELERRVSVEELSAFLAVPADQIRDILRLAGDELKRD